MYSKYMLDIKWMSGDAAASLERAKIESAKDVMNALRRQAIAPKHSEMKLLLAGAALDDEADLRNLPLSVGLTLVAMDIKELVAALACSELWGGNGKAWDPNFRSQGREGLLGLGGVFVEVLQRTVESGVAS